MIVCTVITAAQIPKARIMAESVKRHLAGSTVVVCLVEQSVHPAAQNCTAFDRVLLAKDLGYDWPPFERLIFKYNAMEAICAVKGQLLKDLILRLYRKEDEFLYLDSEMKVFSPCSELFDALKEHSIVITPHQLLPSDIRHVIREVELLNEGTFHGGILGIRRTDDALRFVEWFAERLSRSYEDPYNGRYWDKRFLNLAMAAFDLHVLKHPGYNVAAWNFHERMTMSNDGTCHVQGNQLCIFNFAEWESWRSENDENGDQDLSNEPWSYDYFHSGEKIAQVTRHLYRTNPDDFDQYPDLFAESNKRIMQNHG
ncbi:hypothetical protein [Cohnella thermotolerans]|uniref:hypothetical protein n=1 Tax=Cohnella thermotolerans TaxID=329858 RepID=UPI00040F2928|nr:hypothetical protein [Cohnella thermotolerans]